MLFVKKKLLWCLRHLCPISVMHACSIALLQVGQTMIHAALYVELMLALSFWCITVGIFSTACSCYTNCLSHSVVDLWC